MAFTPVITNEGAAYLASVIALQGNIDIKSVKFSSTNYSGSEAALTAATFLGTFKADASPSALVKDSSTISISATCDNVGITVATNLYSIGIIADDNGTDKLLCVCTTTTPDIVNPFALTASYLHYDVNLGVSSTNDITVSGSVAGGLYVSDIINTLTSTATNKPLSAAMGKELNNNKQPKTLATPITIDGNTKTTVEGALNALNEYIDTKGSGGGSVFKIHTDESTLHGQTVTASCNGVTATGTFDNNGDAEISGFSECGTVVFTSTDGNKTARFEKSIPYYGQYSIRLSFEIVFAFHYSENDSSPNSVTYPSGYDNSNFTTPFSMDLATGVPNYGDWDKEGANADLVSWLFPKPCMLKYDGTLGYYLKESDYTKKEDGTTSDVANMSYGGNAMMEWGQGGYKIYWKIVPDNDGKGFTFVVANAAVDNDVKPWNHYNCKGNIVNHFYTPIYFGSSDGTRMRSISGGTNYVNHDASTELTHAKANNQTSDELWNTEVYADWLLLQMLCTLISKSTNSQAKFGYGRCKSDNSSAIGQGTMNDKGLFYGVNDQTSGVKVFGMENPWGNLWRRIAGLINANGTVKVKLTYGQQDGSTTNSYNTTGSGYITHGTIGGGTDGGFISHMNITNRGITPNTMSGSDNTYYTDGGWSKNSQVNYAFVGGAWHIALPVGAFCCNLSNAVSVASTDRGASLSCKPLA